MLSRSSSPMPIGATKAGASKVKAREKRTDADSMKNIGTTTEEAVKNFAIPKLTDADELNNQVAPKVYTVTKTDDSKIYLEAKCDSFNLPEKFYGKSIYRRNNIVADEYKRADKSVGILLSGQRGCGKSQQAEYICNCALLAGLPVLFIDKPYSKVIMEDLIRRVGPCVVFIDEYSKIYRASHDVSNDMREELLTLFSDRTIPKCLFILTDNLLHDVSRYIIERPGRFVFAFAYEGCDNDVIADICKQYSCNESITEFIINHGRESKESIDSILTLARFGARYETVKDFVEVFEYLNVKKPAFRVYRLECPKEALEHTTAAVVDGDFHIWYKKGVEGKEQHFVEEKSCKFRNMYRYNIIDNEDGVRCNVELKWDTVREEPEANYKIETSLLHERWL